MASTVGSNIFGPHLGGSNILDLSWGGGGNKLFARPTELLAVHGVSLKI